MSRSSRSAIHVNAPRWACRTALPVIVLLSGCTSDLFSRPAVNFERGDWSYAGRNGSELRTTHYTLRTTHKDRQFVDTLPGFLESCWEAYAELLPPERPASEAVVTYLFPTRRDWERFTEEFAPGRAATYKRIRSGGYSERGITVSHYSSRLATLSILAHEGLHQYLEVTRHQPVPPWLNEGLACYFESFDLDSDNRPVFTPERNALRRAHLAEALVSDGLIPLQEILGTHAGEQVHKRSADVRGYYAQEWSLVLFLLESPFTNPYHDGFEDLLRELGTDEMVRKTEALMSADSDGRMTQGEAVFRAYITDDLQTFQSRYMDYCRRLLGLDSDAS